MSTKRPWRIIVTGDRDAGNEVREFIHNVLYVAVQVPLRLGRPVVLVEGECSGVDTIAREWGEHHLGVTVEPHPADWDTYGKAAGPRRNQEMADAGAEMCLAFPARLSGGTWNCIERCASAGIHVRIYPIKRAQ